MDQDVQDKVDNVKKNLTAQRVTKFVVGAVVGHCVAHTVKTIIRSVHPETDSKTDKVKLEIAAYTIGGAVAMRAKRVTDYDIDDAFKFINGVREGFNKTPVTTVVPGEVVRDTTPSE